MNRLLFTCLFLFVFCAPALASHIEPWNGNPERTSLPDTIDPVIFCPNSQIITMGHLKCDSILTFMINAFDDQGQVTVSLVSGIGSGFPYPVGTTVTTYKATDAAGNTATCSFSITLNEPMTQPLCHDLITVNLDANCTKTLKPMEVLEGGPYGCPINYIVEVDTTMPFGNGPWQQAVFTSLNINKTYQARVTYLQNNARCTGMVQIKDNLPPVLQCANLAVPCALPESQLTPDFLRDSFGIFLAYPSVGDACTGSNVTLSFVNVFQNLPCDSVQVSGIIQRIWSATDANNNTGTCLQIITRTRLLSGVQFPGHKILNCQNLDLSTQANGIPFVSYSGRKYPLTNDTYCEFSWTFDDQVVPGTCAGRYTVQRTWQVFDACLALSGTNPKIGVQVLEVTDNSGPVIQCPLNTTITVQDVNCRGAVDIPNVTLSDACSGASSLQASWVDLGQLQTLTGVIQYDTTANGIDTLGLLGTVSNFPVGTRTVTYSAVDDCGQTGTCTFQLTVANPMPPVAACEALLEVTLPPNGFLNVSAAALDDGSTDDCSALVFRARLLANNLCDQQAITLQDTLMVCCRNIGDTLDGILRVYDIAVPSGAVAENFGAGHFSECAFQILVSGVVPPTCVASPNVTVSCEAFDPTFQAYGGIASQSCSVDSVTTTVSYSLFDTLCSRGTITRLFNVYNGAGQSGQCTQKIVSNYNQDYFIRFPNDVIVTSCDTTGVYGTPVFFGEDCEQFSITYTDEIFDVVPDACYKIDRTWTIYNECTYDPLLPRIIVPNPNPVAQSNHPDNLLGPTVSPIQTPGDPWKTTQSKINPTDQFPTNFAIFYDPAANGYQYKQIIKVIDNEDPVIENCYGQAGQIVDDVSNNNNQLWNAQYWFDPLHISSDLCEGAADIGIVATDACSREQLSVEFQLLLDLNGDNVRETVINSTQLPPSNTVYFNNVSGNSETRQFDFRPVPANQKWRFAKQEIISGNRRMVNIRFNSESQPANYVPVQLPYGNHKIKWFVKDACLNESVCEYNIIIRDVKAPTVLCQSGVNVNMLVFQQAPLSTLDLLQYQEDNCTPSQFLVEGLRKSGTGFGFPLDNSGNPVTTIEFGCDELGPQMVELWSRDRYGNSGVCLTTVNIVDNSDNCSIDQSVDVSGKITTELNDGIVDVAINIESGIGQFTPPFSLLPGNHTDTLGNYTISGSVPIASSFTIRPFNDDFPLNGLTTFDLVLISKHILGIEALGSPLKLIAADANRSNSITTSDIVELRKLILGIYNFLPNNDSWRFIPKSYTFPNPLNPFAPPFPDSIRVVELLSDMTNGNFWGVKIGDVNNTVESNATAQPDDRQAKPVYFDLLSDHAEKVQSGDIIDLRLQAAEALQGCQFTLDFNGLELLEIVPAEHVGQEHFARFPEKNSITFAWEKGGTPAFGFKVRAREAGELHQKLSISSNITKAEAYPSKNPSVIGWPIIRGREMQGFELYQNQPNPFFGSTEIRFNLPEASEATLEVTDMSGRVIYTHTGYYQQGMHLLKLEKDAVDVRGVLYYRLQTPTYSAQRKMVRL